MELMYKTRRDNRRMPHCGQEGGVAGFTKNRNSFGRSCGNRINFLDIKNCSYNRRISLTRKISKIFGKCLNEDVTEKDPIDKRIRFQ